MKLLTGPVDVIVYLLGEFIYQPLKDRLTHFDAREQAARRENVL